MATKKKIPIDPATGPTSILAGRIVTMNAANKVFPDGRLYIKEGTIVAVQDAAAPRPPGFSNATITQTHGTIYPGLIELHNHLAYNALRLWQVPKKYTNRDQWAGIPEYRKLISGPMQVVGRTPELLPALIRYVEAKCLLAGVTTSQGISLSSNAGIRRFYRGIVRNVEETDEAALPEALARIPDLDNDMTATKFFERLKKQSCFLLHLSEGIGATARKHFRALQMPSHQWAITNQLTGIHAAGLTATDMKIHGKHGGAMVWSPMSNLLLYGGTADVAAAHAHGVRIGIGSDWSPSGSKNLLGELKVAKLFSQNHGDLFSSRDIIAMATSTAANMLKWNAVLGTLEAGKRADLLVVDGAGGDPFDHLIEARETDIALVLINGVPRFGTAPLFSKLGVTGAEIVKVGGASRRVFWKQETQDPQVGKISLSDATEQLVDAFKKLPQLAKKLEKPVPMSRLAPREPRWELSLDEIEPTGAGVRPNLLFGHQHVAAQPLSGTGSKPLSQIVVPLDLDALTVANDADFLDRVDTQQNIPAWLAPGLRALY
ncbi:MAG TPA: amidohydrolase family protein [Steroidobacteraceae bacterium]|jgi:cytosine/adenosine deaminase-related metal-dependent hydrolase|nr:amidohydrolase family protein [Steroidobacteraceae bacterium]